MAQLRANFVNTLSLSSMFVYTARPAGLIPLTVDNAPSAS